MPELPEVETVKRELSKSLIGQKFLAPIIINLKCVQTDKNEYIKGISNSEVSSLSREGKFLIIHLNNNHKILFHLRMEGKLFFEEKNQVSKKHLSLYIPTEGGNILSFYDTRKFGVTYFLREEEKGPLSSLGLEPSQIKSSKYLVEKISKSNKCIKQLLLDQRIIAGLGNIYADEVLFASGISPFKKGCEISNEEVESIIKEAKRIILEAIKNNGSTIRTYQASNKIHGNFQSFLKVYGKEGEVCRKCKKAKIERKKINSRSTYYCPICQKEGVSVAITGNIASGKTTVSKIFEENGFVIFNADKEVSNLYNDINEINEIKKRFKDIVKDKEIDKKEVVKRLLKDSIFKKKYEAYIFAKIKERINEFFIENNGKKKLLEIPLLFNSKMENLCSVNIGVESELRNEFLTERKDQFIKEKILLDQNNKYKENKNKLDYIILNNSTIENLKKQTQKIIKEIETNYKTL